MWFSISTATATTHSTDPYTTVHRLPPAPTECSRYTYGLLARSCDPRGLLVKQQDVSSSERKGFYVMTNGCQCIDPSCLRPLETTSTPCARRNRIANPCHAMPGRARSLCSCVVAARTRYLPVPPRLLVACGWGPSPGHTSGHLGIWVDLQACGEFQSFLWTPSRNPAARADGQDTDPLLFKRPCGGLKRSKMVVHVCMQVCRQTTLRLVCLLVLLSRGIFFWFLPFFCPTCPTSTDIPAHTLTRAKPPCPPSGKRVAAPIPDRTSKAGTCLPRWRHNTVDHCGIHYVQRPR